MKAIIQQVITVENFDCFGSVYLKLIPETEEEKKLFERIGDNHARLCDEESDEQIVSIGDCCTSGPMEMDILFVKPTRVAVEK